MWYILLEGGESSQFAWRQILDGDRPGLRKYLTGTGRFADFIPCGESLDCGWRISSESTLGRCPEGVCSSREFSKSELAMVDVDWGRLLGDLGEALGLSGSPDIVEKIPVAMQLGWIAPTQSARFPVYFCAPTSFHPAFPMIQRLAERAAGRPFVLVIASHNLLDSDSLGLLHSRKAETVFLEQEVEFDGRRLDARNAADRLVKFALTTAGVSVKPPLPKFPTPEGAQWKDFKIVELDDLTIQVCATVRLNTITHRQAERYTYEALGLAKVVSGRQVPTKDGAFLVKILRHRRVSADSQKEWDSLRGYRKRIGAILQEVIGIPSEDAFSIHENLRCYEANFQVECAPGEEHGLPLASRRLNRDGRVARGSADE